MANLLHEKGYDTYIRPVSAYSTLGWFDDPLLSTMLDADTPTLIETIIHETLHSTIWIKSNVQFNEALATFVGLQGAIDFFLQQKTACSNSNCLEVKSIKSYLLQANLKKQQALLYSRKLTKLHTALTNAYTTNIDLSTKLSEKQRIIQQFTSTNSMKVHSQLNNAKIYHDYLYYNHLHIFNQLYNQLNSLTKFIDIITSIANGEEDSYTALAKAVK